MSAIATESRVRIDLIAVVVAVDGGQPYVLTVDTDEAPGVALPSGPLVAGHRTLQAGLRAWVEAQTKCRLEYVEQLYTFGDRTSSPLDAGEGVDHRAVSIAYLALVAMTAEQLEMQAHWLSWYALFPWEDRREGEPAVVRELRERLVAWGCESGVARRTGWEERVDLTFGTGRVPWDEERALERYEMLYSAGLVDEAFRDREAPPPRTQGATFGVSLAADHRRIAATAISRLRAKIKYRPVLFELMPPDFTLSQLQRTAEALSGIALHKQNFRRLVEQQNLVEDTGGVATDTGGRPAKLMRFRED
ncbi:MAG: hypothetical protein KDC18_18085, partial [Alphaproteobacteria bacterium]|nr:hypothetical protein [Alphaproteobacteria bacterium]